MYKHSISLLICYYISNNNILYLLHNKVVQYIVIIILLLSWCKVYTASSSAINPTRDFLAIKNGVGACSTCMGASAVKYGTQINAVQ